MIINAVQPILPPDLSNPQRTERLEAGCTNNFNKRLNQIQRDLNAMVKRLPYSVKRVNQEIKESRTSVSLMLNKRLISGELYPNAAVYVYELSTFELNRLMQTLTDMINSYLMTDRDGNLVNPDAARRLWLMEQYVQVSDESGTNAAFRNLSAQSAIYEAEVGSLQEILMSEPYQTRIGFVAAREFNLMRGFTDDIIKETRNVLSYGMLNGDSPRTIARALKKRIDVSRSRAERISRTEINAAHRTARWSEAERASDEYDLKIKILHLASYLPNVRPTHLARSGNLYTTREQREWYQKDGNAIQCRCSSLEQVVDSKGKPINDGAIKKIKAAKEDYRKQYEIA